MRQRPPVRHRTILLVEFLESRLILDGAPIVLSAPDPTGPSFGLERVYAASQGSCTANAIFDTGATVNAVSLSTQTSCNLPIGTRDGAVAYFMGHTVVGDVSRPINVSGVPKVKLFVSNERGSAEVPDLAGTPSLNPSQTHPSGSAAVMIIPDDSIDLVEPSTPLPLSEGSLPVTIPVNLFQSGASGDLTQAPIPVARVSIAKGSRIVRNQNFIVDTGAQLNVISPTLAAALGIDAGSPGGDLNGPVDPFKCNVELQTTGGANGEPQDCGGAIADWLEVPDIVRFTGVPLSVMALPAGVDGIMGTAVFARMYSLMYNPYGPWVKFSYYAESSKSNDNAFALVVLYASNYDVAGTNGPTYQTSSQNAVELDVHGGTTDTFLTPSQLAPSALTLQDSYRQAIDRFHLNSSQASGDVLGREMLLTLSRLGGLSLEEAT